MDRSKGYNRRARKIIHLIGGLPALILPLFPQWLVLAGAIGGVALAYALKPTHARFLRYITKPSDRLRGVISGVRSYFVTILALVAIWLLLDKIGTGNPLFQRLGLQISMFGWLSLAFGDGLAGLIGPSPAHTPTVPWNRHKTWWGMFGCFLGTLLAYLATILLSHLVYFPAPLNVPVLLLTAVFAAVCVAVAESHESGVDDNYIVGGTAALVMLVLVQLPLQL